MAWTSCILLTLLAAWSSTAFEFHARMRLDENLEELKASGQVKATVDPAENTIDYWNQVSFTQIKKRLAVVERNNVAKNLIIFLGDGMSHATVAATRVYMGQLSGKTGEEQSMSWESFPFTGNSKTYCVDRQVADSACSGTAYLNGVKTNYKTIGVTADVKFQDWENMRNTSYHTTSILAWAQQAGKGTGIVTTCSIVDASPTATYAHIASRWWQDDQEILKDKPDATGVKDIAAQLIEDSPGIDIKVIMGGGRKYFLPKGTDDGYGTNGTRGDGKNLLETWKQNRTAGGKTAVYVDNLDQLNSVDISKTDYLMGLFAPRHFVYNVNANLSQQPTLEQMTEVAINMMKKEENGYFLFIEGGQIDHGHHDAKAHVALDETYEFSKAIQKAVDMTSEDDTLIVVTADHAHTMTYAGYPLRGSDIFTNLQRDDNGQQYPTLGYANGPGVQYNTKTQALRNLTTENRTDVDYVSTSTFSLDSETHDGQDVGVWARGPGAHLLVGSYEQTVIPHAMAYAARIGPAAALAPADTDTSTAAADVSTAATDSSTTSAAAGTASLTAWVVLTAVFALWWC